MHKTPICAENLQNLSSKNDGVDTQLNKLSNRSICLKHKLNNIIWQPPLEGKEQQHGSENFPFKLLLGYSGNYDWITHTLKLWSLKWSKMSWKILRENKPSHLKFTGCKKGRKLRAEAHGWFSSLVWNFLCSLDAVQRIITWYLRNKKMHVWQVPCHKGNFFRLAKVQFLWPLN